MKKILEAAGEDLFEYQKTHGLVVIAEMIETPPQATDFQSGGCINPVL